MLDQINERLGQLKPRLRAQQKLVARLARMNQAARDQKDRLAQLDQVLKREAADVERLKGLSIAGLFHSVMGNKKEKIREEEEELVAATLRHDECQHELQSLEGELESLSEKLEESGDLQGEYQALLGEKEECLRNSKSPVGRELSSVVEALVDMESDRKELGEAIAAGRAAESALGEVVRQLEKARGWGQWDMLGGGLLTTMQKHSHIDEARSAARHAQRALRQFQLELEDVGMWCGEDVQVGEFHRFMDLFLDGLFVDWAVQSKIVKSLDDVDRTSRRTENLIHGLKDKLAESKQETSKLEARRAELLDEA